jgi:hypothetical protein
MREMEGKFSSAADNSCVSFETRLKEEVWEIEACQRERGETLAEEGRGDSVSRAYSPTARRKRERDGEVHPKQIVCKRNAPATLIKQFLHKNGVPRNSFHRQIIS